MSKINNVTSIDTAYEKLLNTNQLTEDDITAIEDILGDDDPIMLKAKEEAKNSDLKDTAFIGETVYNTDFGNAIMTDEIDIDESPSYSDLISEINDYMQDVNYNTILCKACISKFFAVDNTDEAFEAHGITNEVIDNIWEVVDKFKLSKKTGKKFSYYNAMPDPIKNMIIQYQGTNALRMPGGNANREARNFITSAFLNDIITIDADEVMAIDLERCIAKETKELEELQNKGAKELAESKEWAEATWKIFTKQLPKMAIVAEEKGWVEEANKYKAVIGMFKNACTFKSLITSIKSGLKLRKIDLEKFDKYCEKFNSLYANTEYVINDVYTTYVALSNSSHFNEEQEVYKRFIAYFIAFCIKSNFTVDNIVDHTYMYYFIKNILLMDFYNPNDEDDVKFHTSYIKAIQNALNVVKSTMDIPLEEDETE